MPPRTCDHSCRWRWWTSWTSVNCELSRGELRAHRALVTRLLTARFGELPSTIVTRIEAAPKPALERWAEALLFAASLDAVFAEGTDTH
jgi:hypothetical protein